MSSSGATWGDRSLSATRVCSAFTRPSLRQAGAPGSTWAARVLSVTERGLGGRGAVAFVTMAAVGRRTDPRSAEIEAEARSEEHTSELQSRGHLVCRLLL